MTVYVERLAALIVGRPMLALEIRNPFILRSVEVSRSQLNGTTVQSVKRLGKRIVIGFEGERFAVIHLMIAGRLRWRAPNKPIRTKLVQAVFEFEHGLLHLTEAGTQHRASLHLVQGRPALARFDRRGLEIEGVSQVDFRQRLRSENHTLKRALTDPRMLSGIGNAFSDEILHRAKLSPLALTSKLSGTTASPARRVASCWPIGRCRGCSGRIGRDRWKSSMSCLRDRCVGLAVDPRRRG